MKGWRRMMGRGGPFAAASVFLLFGCAAPPPPNQFEKDFEEQSKPWQEIETQLPAAPLPGNLQAFAVSGGSSYRFAVDAKSITIGTDGVFRYTLVATSDQGAKNVSYEGIRCVTSERKLYATGRSDGTWVRSRNSAWLPIDEVGNNRQHAALLKEYFCPDAYAARSVDEILERMKRKANTIL